jgi:hypothetical protein
MFFIEDENFLTNKQKLFINQMVLGDNFPYFLQSVSHIDGGDSFMCHIALNRPEERNKTDGINSPYYENFKEMLETFCKKNNIVLNEIFRIAVNLTYPIGKEDSLIHIDHNFEHKQLIIYYNEPIDKDSNTVILNKDGKTILKEISPKKFKGVCFESNPHYLKYPKNGERVIGIFTFR